MSSTSGLVHLRSLELSTAPVAAALVKIGVLLAAQVVQHLIVREAAAVEAHVQHDGFLVEVVGVERAHEAIQPRLVHARDVDVAELALAQLGHPAGVLFDPALVHQVGHRPARGLDNIDTPRWSSSRPGRSVTCRVTTVPALSLRALAVSSASVNSTPSMASTMSPGLRFRPRLSAGPRLRISRDLQAGTTVTRSKISPSSAVYLHRAC